MERQRKEDIEFEKKLDAFAEKAIVAVENITWKCFAGFGLGSAAGLVSQGIYSNHPAFPPSLVIRGAPFTAEIAAKQMFLTGTRTAWIMGIISLAQQVGKHSTEPNALMIANGIGFGLASVYGSFVFAPSSVPVVAKRLVLFSGLGVGMAYARELILKAKGESSTPQSSE